MALKMIPDVDANPQVGPIEVCDRRLDDMEALLASGVVPKKKIVAVDVEPRVLIGGPKEDIKCADENCFSVSSLDGPGFNEVTKSSRLS